jgi:hypothetical protein
MPATAVLFFELVGCCFDSCCFSESSNKDSTLVCRNTAVLTRSVADQELRPVIFWDIEARFIPKASPSIVCDSPKAASRTFTLKEMIESMYSALRVC